MKKNSPDKLKKKQERIILDYFASSITDFPEGRIRASESPDFIISPGPKQQIGIELTRLTRSADDISGQKNIQVDSLEKDICDQSKTIFENKRNIPLYVDLYFRQGISLLREEVLFYANLIASDIDTRINSVDRKTPFHAEISDPAAGDILDSIHISYLPAVRRSFWDNTGEYMIPSITPEHLQKTIGHKEEKLQLYRKNIMNAYWLLIYADNLSRNNSFNINNQLESWNLNSEFDRVYLFGMMELNAFRICS